MFGEFAEKPKNIFYMLKNAYVHQFYQVYILFQICGNHTKELKKNPESRTSIAPSTIHKNLVDPVSSAQAQTIESIWLIAKRRNKKQYGIARIMIDSCLRVFMEAYIYIF